MNKHAYLIMAHNNFALLAKLLTLLDDERNDIYLHVDKKARDYNSSAMSSLLHHASLTEIKRETVAWGGFSQIRTELRLLEAASKTYHAYYHLISGVDFPLKTQDEIHAYFDQNPEKEYIQIDTVSENGVEFEERLRYYRFFQDHIGRNHGIHIAFMEKLDHLLLTVQKKLRINRIHQSEKVYKGPNWFSITHNMAQYILQRKKEISHRYRYCLCADEIFLQTIAMNSPLKKNIVNDALRYIDWIRGSPYTFTSSDFQLLTQSDCMFARKFDEKTDFQIIEELYNYLFAVNS